MIPYTKRIPFLVELINKNNKNVNHEYKIYSWKPNNNKRIYQLERHRLYDGTVTQVSESMYAQEFYYYLQGFHQAMFL